MPTEIIGTMAVSGGQKQTALLMPGAYPAERITYQSVSVTADGVKTYRQVLNELYSLLDTTKITHNSYVKYGNYIYRLTLSMSGAYQYTVASIASSNTFIQKLSVNAATSGCERMSGTTFTDLTTQAPTNGAVFTLYY